MLLINHDPDEVSADWLADHVAEADGVDNVDIFSSERDDDDEQRHVPPALAHMAVTTDGDGHTYTRI
jgi:hypothetical protein